jgi:hypothetical protein
MFAKNLTGRERYLGFLAATVIAIAVLYNLLIAPLADKWACLNREVRSKTNLLAKNTAILASEKTLSPDHARMSKFIKSTSSEEEEVSHVLAFIENISRKDSCFVVNIKPMGTKSMGAYKELLVDVAAEADMERFSKFVYDIENSADMILRVKRFAINAKTGQSGSPLRGTFLISKIVID